MGAAIVGTIEQVGIATVITVPLGILTATYLASNDNPFSRTVSAVVDAMTGAPAIIAGLFVYLLWVVPHHTAGKTGFAAALALAVMMLPVVTRAAQEVVAIVPGSYREAALALGAPEWRVLLRVVLPTARAGLMTAVILGVARIAGETAPVLFNAGGFAGYNCNPFSGQQDNLPLRIYELIFQPGKRSDPGRLGHVARPHLRGAHPLRAGPQAGFEQPGSAAPSLRPLGPINSRYGRAMTPTSPGCTFDAIRACLPAQLPSRPDRRTHTKRNPSC